MRTVSSILFFTVAALLSLGLVMLSSASTGQQGPKYMIMQAAWAAIGILACWLCAAVDYRWFKKYPWIPWVILALAVGLLLCVYAPVIGIKAKGARRWIRWGGFGLQPSELAKVGLIIVLAYYGERYQRQMPKWFQGVIIPGLIIGIVAGLIFIEPDVGTALLVSLVGAIMLYAAGSRISYLAFPALVLLAGLAIFLWQNPMRSERIYSWLHVEETKQEKGMQAYQAMVALGAGGVTGLGLGDGTQKLGWVPEHHTDFIFSIIGEELGLAATLAVVAGFCIIMLCGFTIAGNARDKFGSLIATGITSMITIQSIVNLGVVTGSLPNKGMSLPFMSYGGSNLVIMLACVGLLLNIAKISPQRENIFAGEATGAAFNSAS